MIQTVIKRVGRPVVCTLAFFSGYCVLARGLGLNHGTRILSYHGIQEKPSNPYAVSTYDFSLQMQHLAEQFKPLALETLIKLLKDRAPLPPRAIAVTFDDGYSDVYDTAYPILKSLSIPATVFLPAAFIHPASSKVSALKLSQANFLSWEQVQEMSQEGMISFGSHTLRHFSLAKIPSEEVLYELESSKAAIEEKINRPVQGIAYPYGTVRDFNPQVKQLTAAAGYHWAVTGLSGLNTYHADFFALRRTKIERSDSMYIFKKAVRGALDPWILVEQLGRFL